MLWLPLFRWTMEYRASHTQCKHVEEEGGEGCIVSAALCTYEQYKSLEWGWNCVTGACVSSGWLWLLGRNCSWVCRPLCWCSCSASLREAGQNQGGNSPLFCLTESNILNCLGVLLRHCGIWVLDEMHSAIKWNPDLWIPHSRKNSSYEGT